VHLAFAGLSVGVTHGDVVSPVIALSGGFMPTFTRAGMLRVFIADDRSDFQLALEASVRPHAIPVLEAGLGPLLPPCDGNHVIVPWVVERAIAFFMGPVDDDPPKRP
jgi:phospholipase/carboxylesterase